jgi:hypothetical protein
LEGLEDRSKRLLQLFVLGHHEPRKVCLALYGAEPLLEEVE